MKNPSLLLLLIFLQGGMKSFPQNLVLNGGFEEENICVEYKQACAPVAWKQTCFIVLGYYPQYIKAFRGRHYLPVIVQNTIDRNFRTYWQTRILCPLQKGETYLIRFTAAAWGGNFYPENLGIYFGKQAISQPDLGLVRLSPDIFFNRQQVQDLPGSHWVQVMAEYTARGDEEYLLIGNFRDDAHMTLHEHAERAVITYCIDEFQLIPRSPGLPCADSAERAADLRADRYRHSPRPVPRKEIDTVSLPPPVKEPVPVKNDTIILPDLLFEFDRYILDSQYQGILDSVLGKIKALPYRLIIIEGHTDNRGSEPYNLDLSFKRARTIAGMLAEKGIDSSLIKYYGLGESRPVASNTSPEGRRRNRRVEIIIQYK